MWSGAGRRGRLRGRRARLAAAAAGALALAAPVVGGGPLHGQTPFTGIGLGYPTPPVDARAAGLGSTGVGLLGGGFTLRNPAEIAVHPSGAVSLTFAPEIVDIEGDPGTSDSGRSRVSVIRALARMGAWAVAIGFGSELDQDFGVGLVDTLATSVGRFPFEETREHDGGVSAIDVSLARNLGPLMLGFGVQRLTGNLRQEFVRRFQADVDGGSTTLESVGAEALSSYGAWRGKAGAALRLGGDALLGGSVGLTGDMKAEVDTMPPLDPRAAPESRTFDMPANAEFGGSVLVADRVLVAGAGGWVGWSEVDGAFEGVRADDVRWGGAGLEVVGLRLLGVGLPLRLGARVTELPFFPEGQEQPTERSVSFGVGALFQPAAGVPAEVNAALELGSRGDLDGVGLEESFRRLTIGFVLRS